MAAPREMKLVMVFDDGSQKEVKYELNPLRNGDNPHQAGYIGEPGNSYVELIEGRGMGFTNHIDLSGYSVAVEISKTMKFLDDNRTETVVINKHTNPAIFAARTKQIDALLAALATDTKSPFGGIMATSSRLTRETTDFLVEKNRKEIANQRNKEFDSARSNLTVEQMARYIIFNQEFQQEMRGMLDEARGGRSGKNPGGRGPGQGMPPGRGPGQGGPGMVGNPPENR
jgi:AICAR transformylase/IMP cyclohydrolase PurH